MQISQKEGQYLISLARRAIEYFLETKSYLPIETIVVPKEFKKVFELSSAGFVRLELKGLRGESGVFEVNEPLGKLITQLAVNAAFFDATTPRLKPYELNELVIHLYLPGERKAVPGVYPEVCDKLEEVQAEGIFVESRGRFAYSLPPLSAKREKAKYIIRRLRLQLGLKRKSVEGGVSYATFSGQLFVEC